jgi:hypothetical protein
LPIQITPVPFSPWGIELRGYCKGLDDAIDSIAEKLGPLDKEFMTVMFKWLKDKNNIELTAQLRKLEGQIEALQKEMNELQFKYMWVCQCIYGNVVVRQKPPFMIIPPIGGFPPFILPIINPGIFQNIVPVPPIPKEGKNSMIHGCLLAWKRELARA